MGFTSFRIGLLVGRAFGLPSAHAYTAELVNGGEVGCALDIGCGSDSHLMAFRPRIRTVGVDAFDDAIRSAQQRDVHDAYVSCDILKEDLPGLLSQLGGERFDLVTLYGVIEHLPKRAGFELLERCEQLTEKFVLVETPNGFQEQGPEFGNEHQRHLSGWFPHDFEGLGYKVYGTTGTKYLRGYAAGPKYNFKGCLSVDHLLARLLRAHRNYRHAFNLIAVKDVRGVPARLS
jgi:hypothetical protein